VDATCDFTVLTSVLTSPILLFVVEASAFTALISVATSCACLFCSAANCLAI